MQSVKLRAAKPPACVTAEFWAHLTVSAVCLLAFAHIAWPILPHPRPLCVSQILFESTFPAPEAPGAPGSPDALAGWSQSVNSLSSGVLAAEDLMRALESIVLTGTQAPQEPAGKAAAWGPMEEEIAMIERALCAADSSGASSDALDYAVSGDSMALVARARSDVASLRSQLLVRLPLV